MSSTSKQVTYRDPANDPMDYLVPLQYDLRTARAKKSLIARSFFGSFYLLSLLILYFPVPVTQLVIGSIYVGQCTVRQFIPIYMILSGIVGIALVIVGLALIYQIHKQATLYYDDLVASNPMGIRILKPVFISLFLFTIGWFIAGQVLVFEVKLRVALIYPMLPEYCQEKLYKAAYILIFVDYLILLIAVILAILNRITSSGNASDRKKKTGPAPRGIKV